jgi:hypothetical protein
MIPRKMARRYRGAQEEDVYGDAGYQGAHKRPEAAGPAWHVAMRPGRRRKLNPFIQPDWVAEQAQNALKPASAPGSNIRSACSSAGSGTRRCATAAGQEHGADRHAVRAVQPVDGAPATDGSAGMSAPEEPEMGSPSAEIARQTVRGGYGSAEIGVCRPASASSCLNADLAPRCADLPWPDIAIATFKLLLLRSLICPSREQRAEKTAEVRRPGQRHL